MLTGKPADGLSDPDKPPHLGTGESGLHLQLSASTLTEEPQLLLTSSLHCLGTAECTVG